MAKLAKSRSKPSAVGEKFGAAPALTALVMLGLSVSACAPNLGPRPSPATDALLAASQSLNAPADTAARTWPSDAWWTGYGDPVLNALVERGLKDAPTLQQAAARMRLAAGVTGQARAAGSALIYSQAGVGEYLQSKNLGFPPFIQPLLPGSLHPLGSVNLDFAYNLDLFGKQHALIAAATSEAEASKADYAQARLAVASSIVAAYADLRRLEADRASAQVLLEVRRKTVALVAERAHEGLDTRTELKTQSINIPAAEQEVARLDQQIGLARDQIAALIGAGPDAGLQIPSASPDHAVTLHSLPAELPAALLGRRADIVAAKYRVQAARKRITAAKADYYPNINLAAAVGYQSLGLSTLFDQASRTGNMGPALTLPIFSGGAANGGYRVAAANTDLAVATYNETLTLALKDVSDALVNQKALAEQRQAAQRGVAQAREAFVLTEARAKAGLASEIAVLGAQAALIGQERQLADLDGLALTYDVALVRALGGGYGSPH